MYEHPIKRAGLTFNRILLSNTRMVASCYPGFGTDGKYRLQFKMKFYEAGKETDRKIISAANIDEVFPARKWEEHYHSNELYWRFISVMAVYLFKRNTFKQYRVFYQI